MNIEYLSQKIKEINELSAKFRPISEKLLISSIRELDASLGRVQSAVGHETMRKLITIESTPVSNVELESAQIALEGSQKANA